MCGISVATGCGFGGLFCEKQEVMGGWYQHVCWVDVMCISCFSVVCFPFVCLAVLVARRVYSDCVFRCYMLWC